LNNSKKSGENSNDYKNKKWTKPRIEKMFTEPQESLDMFGDSVLTTKKIVWKQSE